MIPKQPYIMGILHFMTDIQDVLSILAIYFLFKNFYYSNRLGSFREDRMPNMKLLYKVILKFWKVRSVFEKYYHIVPPQNNTL